MTNQNWIFNRYSTSSEADKIVDLANYIRLSPNLIESIDNVQLLKARLLLHESLKTGCEIPCIVDIVIDISKNSFGEFPFDFNCLVDLFFGSHPFSRTVETNLLLVKNRIENHILNEKYLEEIDQAKLYCSSDDPTANANRFIFDLNKMYNVYSVNYGKDKEIWNS